MAREDSKQRGSSRRRFMQSAAAMAVSGTILPSAARAVSGHDGWRERHPECEGARDLNLVNGRFLTMDADDSIVSAVAILVRRPHQALRTSGLVKSSFGSGAVYAPAR